MTRNAVFHDAGSFDDGSPIAMFPSAVASVFGRTGTVAAVAGDYFGAVPAALTGATQAARFVGATTTGAPASGTFAVGDVVVAQDGHVFVCTVAGTPGTWVDVAAGATVSYATPAIVLGSSAAAGAASTVIRSDSTIAAFDATNPTTQAFGDSAAVGTAAFAARRDHKHAMPADPVTSAAMVAALGGVAWTTVVKGGDTSVSSNTVVAADPDLAFTAASGGVYEVDLFVIYVSTAGAGTPDLKAAFAEDATARGSLFWWGINPTDVANSAALLAGTGSTATFGTAATNRVIRANGHYIGAGGTAAFYWAQNTSGTNATTVKAGSLLRYRRIL